MLHGLWLMLHALPARFLAFAARHLWCSGFWRTHLKRGARSCKSRAVRLPILSDLFDNPFQRENCSMEKSTGVQVSRSAVKKPKNKGDRRLSRLLLLTLLSAGYLLPTAIAVYRKRLNQFDTTLLCILNIGGGWTILGWGAALYLALRAGEDEDDQASARQTPLTPRASTRKVTLPSTREWRGATLGVRPRAYAAPRPSEDLPPALRALMGERPPVYGLTGMRYAPNRYAALSSAQRLLAERRLYSPAADAPVVKRSKWAERLAEEEAEYKYSFGPSRVTRYQPPRRTDSGRSRVPPRQQGDLAKEWNPSGLSRIERFAML
jgi:hypothetical protein